MLADFGADVIRIEPPSGVDANDSLFANERWGGDFQNLNRNKRSLTLNLKMPEGRRIFERMVIHSDVVVENWRPDVKARLGVDYASLHGLNPRIILASISGYGQDGPYVSRPGLDQIIQGMSGLMSVTGMPGQGPVRTGAAVADCGAGLYAALGIMVALLEREVSGKGQWVQANLLHSLIGILDFQATRYLTDGVVPVQVGNDHPTAAPMGLYGASDGVFNLAAAGEGTWRRLCHALGIAELMSLPQFGSDLLRVQNRRELDELLRPVFAAQPVAHWVALLNEASVPAGPVYSMSEVFEDAQVQHLNIAQSIPLESGSSVTLVTQPTVLSRTPATIKCAAPGLGEHTDEILKESGYDERQITSWRDARVI